MFKRKINYFLASLFAMLLTSCSIHQEMSFAENGQMKYNMTLEMIDMGEGSKLNDLSTGEKKDSIVSLAKVFREEASLSLENDADLERDLENIDPLYIRMIEDPSKKEFSISMYGDFKNADAYNKAMVSVNKLVHYSSDKKQSGKDKLLHKDLFRNVLIYSWNGKKMTCQVDNKITGLEADDNREDEKQDIFSNFSNFLLGGKTSIKYSFPKKVKSVSNPEALFSQDQKSVIIEYSGNVLTTEPEKLVLEIELE